MFVHTNLNLMSGGDCHAQELGFLESVLVDGETWEVPKTLVPTRVRTKRALAPSKHYSCFYVLQRAMFVVYPAQSGCHSGGADSRRPAELRVMAPRSPFPAATTAQAGRYFGASKSQPVEKPKCRKKGG